MVASFGAGDGRGRARACGSCGELVQGILPDGTPFHVTCPIERYATVAVAVHPASATRIHLHDPRRSKIREALERTANTLNLRHVDVTVEEHTTDLTEGKGMGSSTADITAAARALADAVGRSLSPDQLGAIAAAIESSDGTMFPGVCAVNHRRGTLLEAFGWYPRFYLAVALPHRSLDTASASFVGQRALAGEYGALLAELRWAATHEDSLAYARAATRSGQLNERFVPNPLFVKLAEDAGKLGALGVVTAHTGTLCGLLYADEPHGAAAAGAACIEIADRCRVDAFVTRVAGRV